MKKVIEILQWIIVLSIIVGLMAFSNRNQKKILCKDIDIHIKENENDFIDSNTINELFSKKNQYPLGRSINEIELSELEKSINNHPLVKNVNVYSDISGKIYVEVQQKIPTARIVSNYDSFYIDKDGNKMLLSENHTARVLVISGNVDLISELKIFSLAKYIDEHSFWRSQIMQIYVDESGELLLIPRVGDQKIVFGKTDNMIKKFDKLSLFYRKGIVGNGWKKYSTINLKFKNQIVCTKK